ncbi:hypothetical protein L6R29_05775 [Myxococcota bacterium]|nr:hypothetical protein [Myxococcota bacterium]
MSSSISRTLAFVCLFGGLLSASWYSIRGYRAWQRRQALSKPWVHAFQEPDLKLPKTPRLRVFGMFVGESSLAEAQAFTQAQRFVCQDNSVRALMRRQRAARVEKLRAQGKIDALSGATWNRPSPRERNPSIRWNCEKVLASQWADLPRPTKVWGRLLYVFDSPQHPLRHASFQYDLHPSKALSAFRSVVSYYQTRLGAPSLSKDDRPIPLSKDDPPLARTLNPINAPPPRPSSQPTASVSASRPASLVSVSRSAPIVAVPSAFSAPHNAMLRPSSDPDWLAQTRKYDRFRRVWRFSGLRVQITLRSFGGWFNLSESIEVPWPIRPDAPFVSRKK